MSAKKQKRKTPPKQHHNKQVSPSVLSRYPRLMMGTGILLVLLGVVLLTVGYVSDARVGLSMLSLFFGGGLIISANSVLPKKRS